jgi:hypothetical protein
MEELGIKNENKEDQQGKGALTDRSPGSLFREAR